MVESIPLPMRSPVARSHFTPEYNKAISEVEYFSAFKDHLIDGSHPEAPNNKLVSDHGQIVAYAHHLQLFGTKIFKIFGNFLN